MIILAQAGCWVPMELLWPFSTHANTVLMDQLTCRWSNATPVIHMVMPSSPPMWMSWVSNHLGYVKPALSPFATQKSLRLSSNCPFREESTSNCPFRAESTSNQESTKKTQKKPVMWKMCPCHGVIMKMVHDILASIFGHFYWHPMIIFKLLLLIRRLGASRWYI